MKYRTLGKTNWQVSGVSMGCWGIGGQWGPVEESEAIKTLHRAVELGVNLFDTADAYGLGRSEELVGKAFQQMRHKVYIATKAGNWGRRLGHPLTYTSPYHIYLCCDASLYRLRSDYIDLYQCHIGDLQEPGIFLEAFETLKKQGKIRAYGISTNSVAVVERFNRNGTCETVQIGYSLLNRNAEKDILPYCQENNIGTLLRGPIAQGLLAGKFTPDTTFTDSVRIGWNEGEGRKRFLENLNRVEQLRFLANERRNLAQAALQFVLAHPAVTCAIPGAKNPHQVESNALASDGELSAEELDKVRKIGEVW